MKYLAALTLLFASIIVMPSPAWGTTVEDYIKSTPQPVVIVSIEDCSGEQEWLVGGTLQNWKAAEVGRRGYTWLWVKGAQEAATIASTWFYSTIVITHKMQMSPSECDVLEAGAKEESI